MALLDVCCASLPSEALSVLAGLRGLAGVAVALAACRGRRVLLLGERLPLLDGAERFWGETVLIPLGRRPEPELPESAVRAALGVGEEELLLFANVDVEIISRAALQSLSRARIR